MNAILKRLLSWALVIAMVLSMSPVIDLSSFAVTSKATSAVPQEAQDAITAAQTVQSKVDALLADTTLNLAAATASKTFECPVCGTSQAWTIITGVSGSGYTGGTRHFLLTEASGGDDGVISINASNASKNYMWAGVNGGANKICVFMADANVEATGSFLQLWYTSKANVMGTGTVHSTVTGTTAKGGLFDVGGGSSLNIYGGTYTVDANDTANATTLTGYAALTDVQAGSAATINIYGGTFGYAEAKTTANYNMYIQRSTVNMYGGTIQNGVTGLAGYSGNVNVSSANASAYGTFNMYGGTIKGGTYKDGVASTKGGNVCVGGGNTSSASDQARGVFKMYAGSIEGGSAYNGGNIYLKSSTAMLMEGGTITNGKASNAGGNIDIRGTTSGLTMNGGDITGGANADLETNTAGNAKYGGAISTEGAVNISGGTIDGCSATVNGGNIWTNNAAAEVTISGTAVIKNGKVLGNSSNRSGGGNIGATAGSQVTVDGGTIESGSFEGDKSLCGGANILLKGSTSAKATLTVNGGVIKNGNAVNGSGGNILALASKVVINGGEIYGGDAATLAGQNISLYSEYTGTILEINGGTIVGDVVYPDVAATDTVTNTVKLTGAPKIISEYTPEGGEKVEAKVYGLRVLESQPIDISGLTAEAVIEVSHDDPSEEGFVFTTTDANAAVVKDCFTGFPSSRKVELVDTGDALKLYKQEKQYDSDVFEPWNHSGKAWCDHCKDDIEGWVDVTSALNSAEGSTEITVDGTHWYIREDVTVTPGSQDAVMKVKNAEVSFCFNLNGCDVTNGNTSNGVAFFIGGGEINLMDNCADDTKDEAYVKGGLWIGNDGGTFNVYGGKYSANSAKATLEGQAGAFNLYGGNFTNNTGAGANVIKLTGANATIDGATVTTLKSNYTIASVTAGKLLLKSGEIKIDGTNYEARCVVLNGTNAVLEVTGGTVSTNSTRSSAVLIETNGGKVNLSGDAKVYGGTRETGNAINAKNGTVTLGGNAIVKSAEGTSEDCINLTNGTSAKLVIADGWAGEAYVYVQKAVVDGETTTYVDYVAGENISTDSITRDGEFTGKLYYGDTELVKTGTNAVMVKSDKEYDSDVFEPWLHGGKAWCDHCKDDIEGWVDVTATLSGKTGSTQVTENAHYYLREDVTVTNGNGSVMYIQTEGKQLCFNLNGCSVTNAGANGYAFFIGNGATINLMDDCADNEKKATVTGSLYIGGTGGTFNVYGGTYTTKGGGSTIRGTNNTDGIKKFNLLGGTFTNSAALDQNVIFAKDANTTVTLGGNATVKNAEGATVNCVELEWTNGATAKLVIEDGWSGEATVYTQKKVVEDETNTYEDYVTGDTISTDSIYCNGTFTGKLYYGAAELEAAGNNAVKIPGTPYSSSVFAPWDYSGKAYCEHCGKDVWGWVDVTETLNGKEATTQVTANAHYYLREDVTVTNGGGSVMYVQNNSVSLCFNLNGCSVTNAGANGYSFYIGGGTINLMDNCADSAKKATVTGYLYLGTNGGTFNVYGGTYTTKGGSATLRTTASDSAKAFNLYGGTFTNNTSVNQNVILLNDANTTVVIDGATVTTAKSNYTIANVTAGTITLKSGEIKIPAASYSGRCVYLNGADAKLNVEGGTISTASASAPAIAADAGTVTLSGSGSVVSAEGANQDGIKLATAAKLVIADGWAGKAHVYVQKAVVDGEETTYVDYARGETISTDSIYCNGTFTGKLYYGDLALEATENNAVKLPPLAYNSAVFEPWNQGGKAWCDHCKDDIEGWVDVTSALNSAEGSTEITVDGTHWYIREDVTVTPGSQDAVMKVKNAEVSFCFNLNGCDVTNGNTSNGVAFFIGGGEINLMDNCADDTKDEAYVKGGLWIGNDGGTFNVYGGKYSANSAKATLEGQAGAFNLYGGNFTNNTGAGANVIKLTGANATIDGATVTTLKSNYTIASVTAGKLLLKSGEIKIDGTNYEARCVVLNGTNAVLEVTGGTVSTNSTRSSAVLIETNGGKVNLSGDAKVYGGTRETGNAINAKNGTVTLGGNAIVKSAEGTSEDCINLTNGTSAKLVIADGWAGEAYVYVQKAVVNGEETTYVDYVAGENISTNNITRDADFTGKLYYKVGEENIVMVKASNNAVRIYKEYNENVFEPWLQDGMAHCEHCKTDVTGWVDVTSTLNAASGGTGATANGTHWYVTGEVTKTNNGSAAYVETAGVELCFNLNGQTVTNSHASGYAFYVGRTGTMNLMDTAGTAQVNGSLYIGSSGGTFNVYGGTYSTNNTTANYGTIRTLGSDDNIAKTFNLYGGTITNNTSRNQNVIYLNDAAATIVIDGATVTTAKSNYTIANVLAGTITLKSGEIKIDGTSYDARCVVLNGADAELNIEGGKLSTNSAKRSAIYIDANGGTVNMSGGIIDASQANNTNNAPTVAWLNGSRTLADGVVTVNKAEFNMSGGTIYGGTTNYVGGAFRIGSKNAEGTAVSYANCAEFNMTGGLIDGGTAKSGDGSNCAGGIFYIAGNTVNIKGGTVKNGVAEAKYGGIFALVAKSPKLEGDEPKAPAVLNISEENAEVPTLIELGTAGTPDLAEDAEGYVSASGGIIFAAEYTKVNISGGTVKGGRATKEGGTIHAYYADIAISGDAEVYSGYVKESGSDGINVAHGTVSVTGDAKVYGVGTTNGNAITAGNSTVTIGGNAIVKSATGDSNLNIYIAPTSKLVIEDGWNGEAYIYAQKAVDGETITYTDYKRGEAIAAATVELKGTYTGKLFYMNIQAFEVEGLATLGNARVMFKDGTIQWTNSEQGAIDLATNNADAYAEIGTNAKLELKGENAFVYIDIDGHALEMTGTGTLYIMDKQNDDYDGAGSIKVGTGITVANEATNPANGNRYVALFSGNSWSAHRMELKLTTISLRTTTDGMYYKATIKCDDALGKRVTGFGTMLSLGSFPAALEDAHRYTSLENESFKLNDEHTVNTTTCNLVNILKADNQGEENTWSMQQVVYANVYVGVDVLGDGHGEDDYDVVAYKDASEVKALSLLDAVEYINDNWSTYEQALTPAAQQNMKAFAAKWNDSKYFDDEGYAAWQAATTNLR